MFSYIEGIDVDGWVKNYYDQHYNKDNIENGENPWNVNYTGVHNNLKERFTDANLACQAQIKIESLYQGSGTAEDFFQKFEILLTQAGYNQEEAYVTRLIETNINDQIIDQIYASSSLPEEYDEWKKKILGIDIMWRCRNKHKKQGQYMSKPTVHQQPAQQPTHQIAQPPPRQSNSSDQRDGTGVMFGGAGKAMEIDEAHRRGLCFHCGTLHGIVRRKVRNSKSGCYGRM